jgi:hypothetical protein
MLVKRQIETKQENKCKSESFCIERKNERNPLQRKSSGGHRVRSGYTILWGGYLGDGVGTR